MQESSHKNSHVLSSVRSWSIFATFVEISQPVRAKRNFKLKFSGSVFYAFLLLRKKDGRHAHTADRFSQRKLVCAVTSIFAEDTPHPTPDLALPLASGIRPSYYGERYGLRKRSKIFEKFKKHRPTATHVFLSKPEKMFVIMF